MPSFSLYFAAHVVIGVLYLLLAWRTLRMMPMPGAPVTGPALALPLIVAGHGALLAFDLFAAESFRFGFALALSVTVWLTVLFIWVEGFFVSTRGLLPIVLPVAAACVVLPPLFPGAVVNQAQDALALRLHLLLAISAYSLLTIAALHALLMTSLDRQLHAPETPGVGAQLFRQVPPLLAMERLLFQLISAGFALLTLTVISGLVFSEELFGRALRFDYKTVFTLLAWIIFGSLLAGRWIFGWRGRVALRWTLTGFVMMFLAYVGSRFVLEVILHRV
jgi:ABC-type uncharacterized transport system permease subunit